MAGRLVGLEVAGVHRTRNLGPIRVQFLDARLLALDQRSDAERADGDGAMIALNGDGAARGLAFER